MKNLLFLCTASFCLSVQAADPSSSLISSEVLLEVSTPIGSMTARRPSPEELERTASVAKAIFVEAFATTYTQYHQESGSLESIEKWLRLKEGLTLQSWLVLCFDEEYKEYLVGKKGFLYLCDSKGLLIGWLSHGLVSETGEMYLSQCSLEGSSRHHRVATAAFKKAFEENYIKQLFPDAKEIRLITRKINTIARHLYIKAGFIMDETIDPSVYGDSYDDRYVGFRLSLEP